MSVRHPKRSSEKAVGITSPAHFTQRPMPWPPPNQVEFALPVALAAGQRPVVTELEVFGDRGELGQGGYGGLAKQRRAPAQTGASCCLGVTPLATHQQSRSFPDGWPARELPNRTGSMSRAD